MEHRLASAEARPGGRIAEPGALEGPLSPVPLLLLLLLACWQPMGRPGAYAAVPLSSSWVEARSEYDWPRGTYGLPVDDRGLCPGPEPGEDDWTGGHLLQSVVRKYPDETGTTQTERGGEGGGEGGGGGGESESVDYATSVIYGENRVSFCLKTVSGDDFRRYDFRPGRYCLWKKQACPPDFEEGWVLLSTGARSSSQQGKAAAAATTTLPDADFSNNSVRLYACCRGDGTPGDPIRLPRRRPFALLRLGRSPCQAVVDMDVRIGWKSWYGTVETSSGLRPYVENAGGGGGGGEAETNVSRLFTCLYVPHRCLHNCPGTLSDFVLFSFVVVVCFCSVVCQWTKGCGRRRRADLAARGHGQGQGRPPPAAHAGAGFRFPYSTLLPAYGFTYYSYPGNARSGQLEPDNNEDNSDDDDDDNDDDVAPEGRRNALGYRLLPVSLEDSDENGGGGGGGEEEEKEEGGDDDDDDDDDNDDDEGDQSSQSSMAGADKQGRRSLSPPPTYEEATGTLSAAAGPSSPPLPQTEASNATLTSSE